MRRLNQMRHYFNKCESVEHSTGPVEYTTEFRQLI